METVSENNKRKRGRPRKYGEPESGFLEEFVRYESDPVRGISERLDFSVRQQQNIIHAERAKDHVNEHFPEYGEWFIGVPQRVMTELGRCLPDEELFRKALEWYFEHGWERTAAVAAKVIRDHRRRS